MANSCITSPLCEASDPNFAEALSKKDDNVNAVVCKKSLGSYLAAATLDVFCIVFPVILCLTVSVLCLFYNKTVLVIHFNKSNKWTKRSLLY